MKALLQMIWNVIAKVLGKKLGTSVASGKGADILGELFGKGNVHLPDILSKFNTAGMKDQVASWISKGKNLPISKEQVEKALGSQKLKDLATKFGIPLGQVSSLLAEHIPDQVDRLTPEGEVPKA
jgi:uncharacterized protein YidB (DUF937 family)